MREDDLRTFPVRVFFQPLDAGDLGQKKLNTIQRAMVVLMAVVIEHSICWGTLMGLERRHRQPSSSLVFVLVVESKPFAHEARQC